MKLVALPAAALLMFSVPALAASPVTRDPVSLSVATHAGAKDLSDCLLPLSIRTENPLSLRSADRNDGAIDTAVVDNPWAAGASSHWNAGMNRAVDHLFAPPENVRVLATQTGDELRGRYEGSKDPNETFAAFEIVIH